MNADQERELGTEWHIHDTIQNLIDTYGIDPLGFNVVIIEIDESYVSLCQEGKSYIKVGLESRTIEEVSYFKLRYLGKSREEALELISGSKEDFFNCTDIIVYCLYDKIPEDIRAKLQISAYRYQLTDRKAIFTQEFNGSLLRAIYRDLKIVPA